MTNSGNKDSLSRDTLYDVQYLSWATILGLCHLNFLDEALTERKHQLFLVIQWLMKHYVLCLNLVFATGLSRSV